VNECKPLPVTRARNLLIASTEGLKLKLKAIFESSQSRFAVKQALHFRRPKNRGIQKAKIEGSQPVIYSQAWTPGALNTSSCF